MSLSSIAVEQREKEAKSLNAFLAFSLIGSLALHIGVLSLGLGKFLSKAPIVETEPIEIAIVELPTSQKLESKSEDVQGNSGGGNGTVLSSSGGNAGFGVASSGASLPKTVAPSEIISVVPSIPQQKLSPKTSKVISPPLQNQKIALEAPAKKIVTPPKIVTPSSQPVAAKPVETPTQTQPAKIITQSKPVTPSPVAKPSDAGESDRALQINNQRLNNLLAEAKNAREQASRANNFGKITAQQSKIAANLRNQSGNGVGTSNGLDNSTSNELRNNGTGNGRGTNNSGTGNLTGRGTGNGTGTNNSGTGNLTGRGTGNGTGINNSGTGRGNDRQSGSTVATGRRNVERQTSPQATERNTNTGSSSGRLACRTCSKPKYPENARKRKLEGKAEISVDVDNKGNVTNVRLARTSGHAELDKAAVEQARNWKFNAPNGAAQGVTAKVDFAIEGSKKSRQNRERRRQRAARKQSVASSQNPPTTPVVRTPARQNTNTALKRSLRRQRATTRRRVDTLPPRQAFDQPRRRQQSGGQTRLRESLRRVQSSSQTRIRRSPATSPSQSKLRQSLRSYQQKSPSTTPNEP